MAPKKAKDEPKVAETPAEPEVVAEPEPPAVYQKCFKAGGQVYYGSCIQGATEGTFVRQGFGRMTASAKTAKGEVIELGSYEGNWENDVMHGNGTYKWPDGSSYEGGFVQGQLHGFGRYEWPEGSAYEGTWAHGKMTGQGRYDSRHDGGFKQGQYHRGYFNGPGGQWVNVPEEQRIEELRLIQTCSKPSSLPVVRCQGSNALPAILQDIYRDGRIPLLVSDETLPAFPNQWVVAADVVPMDLAEVAVAKRRHRAYQRILREAVQNAVMSDKWMQIIFNDSAMDSLPQEWQLSHFFDDMALPLEIFHPKVFNTRGFPDRFAVPEAKEENAAIAAEPASTNEPQARPTVEDVEPRGYVLRCLVSATFRLPSKLEDHDVTNEVIQRYGSHIPLAQACVLLLCNQE